jgi:prolyl-tRNA synthetase
MGVVAEHFSDEKGLVWPENIAPVRVYLAQLGEDESVVKAAEELYEELQKLGITVLYDDRDVRPGEKFADADLMGIPHRVVVSAKTVEAKQYEHKKRTEKENNMLSKEELIKLLAV